MLHQALYTIETGQSACMALSASDGTIKMQNGQNVQMNGQISPARVLGCSIDLLLPTRRVPLAVLGV